MAATINKEMNSKLQDKIDSCKTILRSLQSVVVGFSAGVDSTFLLAMAVDVLGTENVIAAMGISPSLARRERQAGLDLAQQLGAELIEIETGELADPNYAANPPDRCFYCKSDLFARLRKLATERGFRTVLSGANADDTGDFRPGLKAGKELGIRSPLLEAGLSKDDIRAASRAMNLPTWNKPASACLASRVPYGQKVTEEVLGRIEAAEDALKDLGFAQCRLRDHYPVARIEITTDNLPKVVESREQIVEAIKAVGYTYVTLDLEGFRSGSMNDVLPDSVTNT
jgi:uncharacterized protein